MGSGSLAAMAVFETGWQKDMEVRKGSDTASCAARKHCIRLHPPSLEHTAASGHRPCVGSHQVWYLQRLGLWIQRRRLCD